MSPNVCMRRLIFVVVFLTVPQLASPAKTDTTARCEAIQRADVSSIQDVQPMVTNSRLIEPARGGPSYCMIEGRIPIAPSQEFELRLPASNWNGKFLAIPNAATGAVCEGYVKRGYACAPMFRNGKQGRRDDETLGANRMTVNRMDSIFMQGHLLTVNGKALIDRYYGKGPSKSYFMGCSGGGHMAMILAQSFPWDYDGIIAADPNLDTADWSIRALWSARSLQDQSGRPILTDEDTQLLHRAVLEQCDLDDGVTDGVLGYAVGCKFDPAVLACKKGQTAGCLTASQVEGIKRTYAGPKTSDGLQLTSAGVLPGSELQWKSLAQLGGGLGALALKFSFEGATPSIDASNFDFDRDYKRLGPGALESHNNPDLRKFKTAGGKLLVHAGTNDIAQLTPGIVDYYEMTERAMGGRAITQDFFRLFMVPGATHCGRGAGADTVDYLGYLETWVEHGKAPDALLAARVSDAFLATAPLPEMPAGFSTANLTREQRISLAASVLHLPLDSSIPIALTRPLYPYPLYAKYKGSGDSNEAANFIPVSPE